MAGENVNNMSAASSTSTVTINSVEISDGSLTEQPLTRFGEVQRQLKSFVNHLAFRIVSLILIVADIIVLIIEFSRQQVTGESSPSMTEHTIYDTVTLVLVACFFFEVNLRLVALGFHSFIALWYNVVDYMVVVTSFVFTITCNVAGFSEYSKLFIIGRLVRIFNLLRLCTEKKQLETGMRHLVSQNKRRYQEDGFDLDLTYVTDRVIAMSFPSTGKMALYRNPIKEVARFLKTKHPDRYKVYNLCSERSYNVKLFNRQVERFPIDDHNPPLLQIMFRFTRSVKQWLDLDSQNVVAVHCKGGKGRTGTMISVWLIESGQFDSALDSLDYFGSRRTDLAIGNKYQGVETPSQNRYVGYFSYIKEKLNGQMPADVTLRLDKVKMCSIKSVGVGNGSDFIMEIQNGHGYKMLSVDFNNTSTNKKVHFSLSDDYVQVDLHKGPKLLNDIKVIFHCSSKNVPCDNGDVAFFFWFHTAFVEDDRLVLRRDELDNIHKQKTWHIYDEKFAIMLFFSYPSL